MIFRHLATSIWRCASTGDAQYAACIVGWSHQIVAAQWRGDGGNRFWRWVCKIRTVCNWRTYQFPGLPSTEQTLAASNVGDFIVLVSTLTIRVLKARMFEIWIRRLNVRLLTANTIVSEYTPKSRITLASINAKSGQMVIARGLWFFTVFANFYN